MCISWCLGYSKYNTLSSLCYLSCTGI